MDSWEPYDELMRYGADNLYDFINGGAEVYVEYGFAQVITQEYVKGDDSIIFTIYEMGSPEAAFGIFSYNRTPQKKAPTTVGAVSIIGLAVTRVTGRSATRTTA